MKGLLRTAFLSAAVLLVQGTWALAGTTGTINGTLVIEQTNVPVANAKVTASSVSQTSSTTTDNGGHFGFVSLVPDTYTITASKEGVIETLVQRGVTVLADQVQNVTLVAKAFIKSLGPVTVRASAGLVSPGTTANVYSINAAQQARTASLGGGAGADQGYSAIAALPGAYISPGQSGWFQTVNIRGGDYDQVGYEFDGIPVNRSFDNYPTSNLSAIGQQELQLYTGAAPAAAEGQGLSGYINQVIKSGTYPGFGTLTMGVGAPSLYNKASIEVGGATPNRNFSYYVGVGLVNQNPRSYDNNNGVSQNSLFGGPYDFLQGPPSGASHCGMADKANFVGCYANSAYFLAGFPAGPGGYLLGPLPIYGEAQYEDRENVFNFHIGIPHHGDAGKDDIQLLYDVFQLYSKFLSSPSDWGGTNFFKTDTTGLEGTGQPIYFSGVQYQGPTGQVFTAADPTQAGKVVPYAYPSQGSAGFFGEPIPTDQKGTYDNGNGIYKIQYQHNIGTQSYLRAYGYIYYSWWYLHDPMSAWNNYLGLAPDYELWTHTRGGSLQYVNQLSPRNLLEFEGTYSTASTVRDNNTEMFDLFTSSRGVGAELVSAANPTNGICYNVANPGVASSCLKASRNGALGGNYLTIGNTPIVCGGNCMGGIGPSFFGPGVGIPAPSGTACGGPCAWFLSENGLYGTFNTVTPRFWAASLQDTWKPNDRFDLNLGVRENIYTFNFTPTGGTARTFWFNAWNQVACVNPAFNGGNPFDETTGAGGTTAVAAGTPCSTVVGPAGFPAGSFTQATLTNTTANGGAITYPELEPRIAGTYTFGPDDVLRFSAGRYSEPPNAAFEQYNHLAQDLPEALLGTLFYRYGFTGPNHTIMPSISYNYDLSIEHRFANTQTSFRLTPFYRSTKGQQQQLYIAPTQAFVSGFNVGNETNYGAEFLMNFGDFNANGLSGQVSYTYTHSYITYTAQPNGLSPLIQDNIDIQRYNSFTSACVGAAPTSTTCGVNGGNNAFPCFVAGVGTLAAGCGVANAVSNPYYQAPAQPLINTNAQFTPYDIIPVGVQLSSVGYVVPHFATLVLQYKRDKWAFIPAVQFHTGVPYGAPESTTGFDPSNGCAVLAGGVIATDPRYPAGSVGNPADATTCTGAGLVIPDPYTGKFDAIGAFTEPSQLSAHLGIQFEATPRVTYSVNLSNIVNTCFGGTKEPWINGDHHYCLYGGIPGFIPPVGNYYNPGATIQPFVQYPYFPGASGDNGYTGVATPFTATFNVQVKL